MPTIYSLVCYRHAHFQQWEMQHYFLITYYLFLLTREMFHSPDMEHYTAFRYIPGRYLNSSDPALCHQTAVCDHTPGNHYQERRRIYVFPLPSKIPTLQMVRIQQNIPQAICPTRRIRRLAGAVQYPQAKAQLSALQTIKGFS